VEHSIDTLVTKIQIYILGLFGLGLSVLLRKLCIVTKTFCFYTFTFLFLNLCTIFGSLMSYKVTPKINLLGSLLQALATKIIANFTK
jgi:hypothetical protein